MMAPPPNPNNDLISALSNLTDLLQRNYDFQFQQSQKAERAVTEHETTLNAASQVQAAVLPGYQIPQGIPAQPQFEGFEASMKPPGPSFSEMRGGFKPLAPAMMPPASELQQQRSQQQADEVTQERGFRSRLSQMGSNARDQLSQRNDPSNMDMLSWSMLGEHGGPAPIRNMALDVWGQQRSLQWAQNVTGALPNSLANAPQGVQNALGSIGINQDTLGSVSDMAGNALAVAQAHPYLTMAATKAAGGAMNTISNMRDTLSGNQALGQQFGYGAPALGGQNIFGFRNPLGDFSQAAQVGASFNVNQAGLTGMVPGMGFGTGLSQAQASQVTQTLAGQGWSNQPLGGGGIGGALLSALSALPGGSELAGLIGGQPKGYEATLSQQYMRPLMQQTPGLTGEDLGQFTPALRNAGTSIQQLSTDLNSLGTEAQATHETVSQFTSDLNSTAQTFQGMGASAHGGIAVGTGFTNATGLDPQIAAQFAQSPLVQGLGLSQYGVLPSGLGDMNPGAFSNMSEQSLNMLKNATQGLAQNRYANINGRRVLVESGQQAQYDQISSMTGIPSDIVKRMLGDQGAIKARSTTEEAVGSRTESTGMWQMLNQTHGKQLDAQQYAAATSQWNQTVNPTLTQAVGAQAAKRIDAIKSMPDRAKAANTALAKASANDSWNQIATNPNAQTVQVQFTGAAAKYFQQVPGPTSTKAAANAGALPGIYAGSYNSNLGDSTTTPAGVFSGVYDNQTAAPAGLGYGGDSTTGAPAGLM